MSDASDFMTEIINYFATAEESPGDWWAAADDNSSYSLDHKARDGTKFWIDLEDDGTITILWMPPGASTPIVKKFKEQK